jgi:NTE family protein
MTASRIYPLGRILVVLEKDDCLAEQAFVLGKLKVGGFVTLPFQDEALFSKMSLLRPREESGKKAICLSGGGVEGFLFELGVLKALNAHLQSRSVTDFDIFCGISAGAILSAFLANGTEPEEMAAAVTHLKGQPPGSSVEAVTPAIIFDADVKEYVRRILVLGRSLPFASLESMFSSIIKAVPVGFFKGDALRGFMERQLSTGGRTNDFRKLKKELYIGATDQDTSVHTVFGAGQWRDVPISLAVRASTALTPFFEPAKIRGRYFVDGQYTRTSNFHYAIERGGRLVIVIDPLVPVRVDQPGYVQAKGGIFSAIQALKAVIHTRFMSSIRGAAANYPDVDFILFKPEGDDQRVMSGSPMKYNIRTEIINMAYRSTVRKIQRDFEILSGTFAKHGLTLQRHPRLRSSHHAL